MESEAEDSSTCLLGTLSAFFSHRKHVEYVPAMHTSFSAL